MKPLYAILSKNLPPAVGLFLGLLAVGCTPTRENALVDFGQRGGYSALGVYDLWAESPFNRGEEQGVSLISQYEGEPVLESVRAKNASNRFGVRIDLLDTIQLSEKVQYVHLFINRPVEGRMMLIGLGSRRDWPEQSRETVQFQALSRTRLAPGRWEDAVFAIDGAEGVDVFSLVVVPHLESPHTLAGSFPYYIRDLVITNSEKPRKYEEPKP